MTNVEYLAGKCPEAILQAISGREDGKCVVCRFHGQCWGYDGKCADAIREWMMEERAEAPRAT